MLQMRNPDLARLSSALACLLTIQTVCLQGLWFFHCMQMRPHGKKEKKRGRKGKGKNGKYVFRVTKEERNERNQTERLIHEMFLPLPRRVNSPL